MGFKKFTKKDWFKLTDQEKEYHTREFKISQEIFRRRMLIASRVLAMFLIVSIFYIGFIQFKYVRDFDNIIAEHGTGYGYCYMCGLETLKQCECSYYDDTISSKGIDIDKESIIKAEYNSKPCLSKVQSYNMISQEGLDLFLNISPN